MHTAWISGAATVGLMIGAAALSPLRADQDRDQRRQVAPLIRALTDCVARETLGDPGGATAYRENTFGDFARRMVARCTDDVNALINVYDRVSGEGAGLQFLNGPYANDLPRAVLKRIGANLQGQLATRDKAQADEAMRLAKQQADAEAARKAEEKALADQATQEEADRQTRLAEAEQRAAVARAAAAKAEADATAEATRAEAERQRRIEEAKSAETLLIDKAADCSRKQLSGLVKSGESADVLATAVMTICGTEVNQALDAGVAEFKLEQSNSDYAVGEGLYREKMRAEAREAMIALAVQAKTGVGAFAPALSQ